MQALIAEKEICLGTLQTLHPEKTFSCGQCFRWNADEAGVYTGVAGGRAARIHTVGNEVYIKTTQEEFDAFWSEYFDLSRDYETIRKGFGGGSYLKECVEYGTGIRILRQDGWEALCSFILSQCSNIPRIKKSVETLCREFGDEFIYDGESFHSFPSAQTLSVLSERDLAPLRCGYRAGYLLGAARSVASGETDLTALCAADCGSALCALQALDGVGIKVASCTALFGLGYLEAFPVDVWMKRALRAHFPPGFDPKTLGPYAGIAQQYIFYYARSGGDGRDV